MAEQDNIVPHPGQEETGKTTEAKGGGRSGNGRKGGKAGKAGKGNAPVVRVKVRPLATPAKLKPRHWGLMFSFVALVLVPLAVAAFYLWAVAQDQYASTAGFTVRQEDTGGASDVLGGLAQFAGGSGGSDSDILYEFIQSQEIVSSINERIDLVALYSRHWPSDPAFALWPSASIEDLLWHWQRMVRIAYDQSTGLIEIRVLAFEADTARKIANEILSESQDMINALNAQARADVMGYAEADLEAAIDRLKKAREALTRFRTRTQIVDPQADIQGRMGVLNNLQQQLAQALIDFDILLETSNSGDPRLTDAQRRIEVIRDRIADERETFASNEVGAVGEDYPTLIAEFESLTVDREFAEESYRAALAALDVARAEATRQSRYLAAYIQPTLPQTAEFPQRIMLFGVLALFLVLAWGIVALVYYSIRDRR